MIQQADEGGTSVREKIIRLVDELPNEKKQMLLGMLLDWQNPEKRADSRIPCLIPVDYKTDGRVYRDFLKNLGKGGVFIETRASLKAGEKIAMTFSLPNSPAHFKVDGKIAWTEKTGFGVQFATKLNPYQQDLIQGALS